jgi:hypothetical protein
VRKLRWEMQEPTRSKHPYRDSAIIYGCLSIAVVVIAVVTGHVVKGLIAGAAFFAAATAWNWWRFREKEKAAAREQSGGER